MDENKTCKGSNWKPECRGLIVFPIDYRQDKDPFFKWLGIDPRYPTCFGCGKIYHLDNNVLDTLIIIERNSL